MIGTVKGVRRKVREGERAMGKGWEARGGKSEEGKEPKTDIMSSVAKVCRPTSEAKQVKAFLPFFFHFCSTSDEKVVHLSFGFSVTQFS